MQANEILLHINDELKEFSRKTNPEQMELLADELLSANTIYIAGAGRSGLVIRAFAMRLMHLGLKVHVVGDVTSPHAKAGDVLLIGSGSGETKSLIAAAQKARECGMRIALNTFSENSTLSRLADVNLVLPGTSQKAQNVSGGAAAIHTIHTFQPMGSAYEQLSFLVYDTVIILLMEKLGLSSDEMFERHANIE